MLNAAQSTQRETTPRLQRGTTTMVTKDDVTVVLPVLNEEPAVAAVIDELVRTGYRNIVVVDGYSTDQTVQVAQREGVTVILQHGRGKAGAIKTAIDNVSTAYLLVMDGDYTYDPVDIERFLNHANGYDEIVGARSSENIRLLHKLGNRFITFLFNTLMGTAISDVCSGMYLLKSKSAKRLTFRATGFDVEVEVLAQLALHGEVTQVPINYRKRVGQPKLSTWANGFDIFKSIFGLAMRYNPVSIFSVFAASAAVPGIGILAWVSWMWMGSHVFHFAWALVGAMLMLLSSQSFAVGIIAILAKRSEIRTERLFRQLEMDIASNSVLNHRVIETE